MCAVHMPLTAGPVVLGVIDSALRIEDISPSVRHVLGLEPSECVGSVALGAVHPDDLSVFLLGVVRATDSGSTIDLRVRLRSREPLWSRVRLTLAPLGSACQLRLGFVAALEPAQSRATGRADHLATLEARVHRLALEIRTITAALHGRAPAAAATELANAKLTAREAEVLELLLDGRRVPAIARAMFVSQSTVRNHLCAMYRKLDVHSQEELLELLRPTSCKIDQGDIISATPLPKADDRSSDASPPRDCDTTSHDIPSEAWRDWAAQ